MPSLAYLLLQIRDPTDPSRPREVDSFARALGCPREAIVPHDLLSQRLDIAALKSCAAVLIGGSGDYSAAGESPWLDNTLADLRLLYTTKKPTFASCWGFQAMARALGGQCIHDPAHAELGTIAMELTAAGQADILFGDLPSPLLAQAGHEDHVIQLPPQAILLASSQGVTNQAFTMPAAPLYCTQFHPELDRAAFIGRLHAYPEYVERIAGTSLAAFEQHCQETPEMNALLAKFARLLAEGRL